MQQEISTQARGEMDKSQREYYLRQQLRAIQQELGEGEEISEELDAYRKIIADKKIPPEAATEVEKQIKRLERSHPDSAETAIIRTYLDWMTGLPWSLTSEDSKDIERARKILDEDHYDIEKVKERILEFLAVHALKQSLKGPILCFVGPPGVGKTSLGRSIARALDRKFVRLSLGGVRDEAEIRGHRRTYVGAMPGRIIQGIHQAGTSNPVFMLDEIDKIGADYRGDPSAALLEVLDPEQNFSFRDHYLAVPYDLSKVLFIATANVLDPIQPAFLDRMEVIRLSGYTLEEKKAIARRHLIPKQMDENGITEANIEFTDCGHREDHRGVHARGGPAQPRARDRRDLPQGRRHRRQGQGTQVPDQRRPRSRRCSGPVKHFRDEQLKKDQVGVATGLAWTSVGGDILFVEALAVRGKGGLRLTGQLGDVMKESAQAAMSYARAHASELDIPHDFFETHDVHVHVPEGAIPKDGPSAGHHDRDGDDLGLHAAQGPPRRRDDGRDHAAGRGAPDRRRQGEGPRGPRREDHDDRAAEDEPARRRCRSRRASFTASRSATSRAWKKSWRSPCMALETGSAGPDPSAERTSETPAREIPVSAASRRRAPPAPRA